MVKEEYPEGDPFSVVISGEYVINETITYTDCKNGTFAANLTSLPETQEISWTVEVVDQNGKSGYYVDSKGNVFLSDKHEFKFKTLY